MPIYRTLKFGIHMYISNRVKKLKFLTFYIPPKMQLQYTTWQNYPAI